MKQITSRQLSDVEIHECWRGPCSVELRANVLAPLFHLPVIETGDGYFWRADFTLVPEQLCTIISMKIVVTIVDSRSQIPKLIMLRTLNSRRSLTK